MGIPDHLTCLLRNLHAGQEAIRTGHGTTDWLQIGKEICQGCILSPCLFNLCRVHHEKRWAARSTSWNQNCWEKYKQPQICRGHHPRQKANRTLSLLMKVKEDCGKVGLKLNIQKTKITASGPITSWGIDGKTVETVSVRLYFGGLQNHCRW